MMHMSGRKLRTSICAVVALAMVVLALPAASMAVTSQVVYYAPDAYEPSDDSTMTATFLDLVDEEVTFHNLHDADDIDWVGFSAEETGQPFVIETEPTAGRDVDLEMEIFGTDEDGDAVDLVNIEDVNYNDDALWNTYGSQCYFEAPEPGDYLVRINPLTTDGVGEIGEYTLTLSDGIARRIYGANRYDTAAKVSRTIWPMTNLWGSYNGLNPDPSDPECIVVASGENWPDALAGASFATASDGVLLLTKKDGLPSETAAEMERLMTQAFGYDPADGSQYPMTVYILGGTGAVSQAVEDAIAAMDGVGVLTRLAGDSRYETAAAIGEQFDADLGVGTTAFVVSGASPWDALAAGPVAGYAGDIPILMTMKSDVPTVTIDFLTDHGITDVVVLGGTAVIDADAFDELDAAVTNVDRVSGDTRYATALAVAQWGVDNRSMDPGSVTLVSGTNFPDGLAAAPLSYYTGGPMLLTRGDVLADEVYQFFEDNITPDMPSYVVGGSATISDDVYWEFKVGVWSYLESLP
ncbi:cell wall-binding repeat-containing protein [bacterium]|nr:cell wall-binding repeat-containing protein [bacterium]